ncbi:hypothetical protein ACP70R_048075 [Stipagrostis hirtigluma subsp. patula]
MAPPPRPGLAAAAVLSVCLLPILTPPFATAIGVNYGTKGDNLLPPAKVASFIANRTRIDRVKLFDASPDIVKAFAGTGIALVVTAGNGDIPKLATKDGAAAWVAANVAPYYPATDISLVAVGNEIMDTGDQSLMSNLVPAMRSLKAALNAAGFHKIRVSTPHSLGILSVSQPPSASRFRPVDDRLVFAPMLEFHRKTRSPFMVNPYPYFGYNGLTLPYALARPNPGVLDPGTGITYTSMLLAQLDSVFSAMKALGFEDVEIAVGETGWPTKAMDGQIGVSPAEAAEYIRYLIGETSAGKGTPLMPKRTFETYIFALFNENLKPGPVAERNFGLFQPDLTPVYDAGIMKDGAGSAPAAAPAAEATSAKSGAPEHAPTKSSSVSKAAASAPAPSSEDGATQKSTGPSPSEGGSTDEKTPQEEGGDAPASASGPADESSSEIAAKEGDGDVGTEKPPGEGSTAAPAPAGPASKATNLVIPVSSMLTFALSLALHI